ncbi:uncharacterized protein G6M90_00g103390 [Metarhizium brunneum]|uniref:Uncharacterized protein n=1 Tax=Metarhizium brunneum TaxID=500148 RepID=A0A7D5YYR2_9HYPO
MARAAQHNALAPWSCSAPARSGPSAGSGAPGRHQNRDPPAQPGILVSGMRDRTLAPADDTSPRGIVDQSAHLGPATPWAVAAAARFKALALDAHVRETSSRAPTPFLLRAATWYVGMPAGGEARRDEPVDPWTRHVDGDGPAGRGGAAVRRCGPDIRRPLGQTPWRIVCPR